MPAHGEISETRDPVTGVRIRQLTACLAHNWHFYYTYSGWWRNNQCLLFNSHRDNRPGTYSIDLETGRITLAVPDVTDGFFDAYWMEVFGVRKGALTGTHIRTGRRRILYRIPSGSNIGGIASSCDGRYLCLVLCEDTKVDVKGLGQGYAGMGGYFASKPKSRILRISLAGGRVDTLLEDAAWIGHINPSPTHGELFTFCHEGPWRDVAQRIWGMDVERGTVWPIRPQKRPEDAIGHEFWLADGEHVGYQGWMPESPIYGYARYDNNVIVERPFPVASEHFHSNTCEWVVGDGLRSPYMLLWHFDGTSYDGPRVLCKHRSSRHVQLAHVHPRFSPDGDYVLYTSDTTGYANLYQAYLPDFETLPRLAEVVGP